MQKYFILDIFMRLYISLFQNPPKSTYYCIILSAYLFVPVSIWAPQILHRNHMLGEIPLFSWQWKITNIWWKEHGQKGSERNQDSDLEAVNDERRPAAWAGRMSPNVDMDLSLNIPTCPSVSMDPSFIVLSPNLLPACQLKWTSIWEPSYHLPNKCNKNILSIFHICIITMSS